MIDRHIRLRRVYQSPTDGMFGMLQVNAMPVGWSLEPPWRNNRKNESCIPAGAYWVETYNSSRFGKTYVVLGVEGRTGILFHPGNTYQDTDGCIMPGSKIGYVGSVMGVLESRSAFARLFSLLAGGSTYYLTIEEVF